MSKFLSKGELPKGGGDGKSQLVFYPAMGISIPAFIDVVFINVVFVLTYRWIYYHYLHMWVLPFEYM